MSKPVIDVTPPVVTAPLPRDCPTCRHRWIDGLPDPCVGCDGDASNWEARG